MAMRIHYIEISDELTIGRNNMHTQDPKIGLEAVCGQASVGFVRTPLQCAGAPVRFRDKRHGGRNSEGVYLEPVCYLIVKFSNMPHSLIENGNSLRRL